MGISPLLSSLPFLRYAEILLQEHPVPISLVPQNTAPEHVLDLTLNERKEGKCDDVTSAKIEQVGTQNVTE